ncbi:type II toxin-antitoxin system VapC family toxin [Conexibacter sp. S30A1]|uniref:type II toxin-antitoxin system VapC family toxin n=1 Tax=Conexibacter sp. S30A1 TaxID=2937800 RepID=UPI00200C98B4|nr:type II toxin-antitoxin system VapC family toxin [Conexibacter sp. S30A1]
MRLLLDTHVVLWQAAGEDRLGPAAKRQLRAAQELRFSVVSFAEIGVKASIGKLDDPPDLVECLGEMGLSVLGLTVAHAMAVAELPLHHRDPFDRLLIAQARIEGLTLLSADRRIMAYDINVVDATG